jgi:phytoene synthase
VAAVYAFARSADDFADEDGYDMAERFRLLDDWLARLHRAVGPGADPSDPLVLALGHTIRTCKLPVDLFEALLSAFRQDITVTRYATWADVDDYCRRSATPVGRLVLRLFGHDNARLDAWSDAICTALQLTNFWQDFAVDWRRGRIYVPEEAWRAAGAEPSQLVAGMSTTPREWQTALASSAARTRALFEQGRPLLDHVSGRLRWELSATWHGGRRVLELLEQARFDAVAHRPKLGVTDGLVIGWRMLLP